MNRNYYESLVACFPDGKEPVLMHNERFMWALIRDSGFWTGEKIPH